MEPLHRFDHITPVASGKHLVPGEGCFESNLSRDRVSNLADDQDVRVHP